MADAVAEKMNPIARAKAAAAARWGRKDDEEDEWQTLPLEEAWSKLSEMETRTREIRKLLTDRVPRRENQLYKCEQCGSEMKKFVYTECAKDPATGQADLTHPIYLCSTICHARYFTAKRGGVPR